MSDRLLILLVLVCLTVSNIHLSILLANRHAEWETHQSRDLQLQLAEQGIVVGSEITALAKLRCGVAVDVKRVVCDSQIEHVLPLLPELPLLTSLSIFRQDLSSTADILRMLEGLEHLNIHECRLNERGLPDLSPLINLVNVQLMYSGTRDEHLRAFEQLSGLRSICLTGNESVTEHGMRYLVHCKALTHLQLNETRIADLSWIGELTALRRLNLAKTPVEDADLPPLRSLELLEHLDLSQTAVTDSGLAVLKSLPALRSLSLSGTRTTSSGLAALRRDRPDLSVVPGVARQAGK